MRIYEHRSGEGWVAPVGDSPVLQGNRDYRVTFDTAEAAETAANNLPDYVCSRGPSGAELSLNFGNSVGAVQLGGRRVEVRHHGKLDDDSFHLMLEDISRSAVGLPFDFNRPSYLPFNRTERLRKSVLYHKFAYLRYIMNRSRRHDSLQAALRHISARPHRRQVKQWQDEEVSRARRVEPQTVQALARRKADLIELPKSSSLLSTRLARKLEGRFPQEVRTWEPVHTHDTPENRFVKHFAEGALDIVEQFRDLLSRSPSKYLDATLRDDCRRMKRALEAFLRRPFVRETDELRRLPLDSSVLNTRSGYREVLRHFSRLSLATNYPIEPEDLCRIIETKDIATLYEYWCFFLLVRSVAAVLGRPVRAKFAVTDELRKKLNGKLCVEWDTGAVLSYQKHYASETESYSVALCPDYVLTIRGREYVFDAKFRVNRIGAGDDEQAEDAYRRDVKNVDLYKMQTYRDALPRVNCACVLYPGNESIFYEIKHRAGSQPGRKHLGFETVESLNGVGAVPCLPTSNADSCRQLSHFIQVLCRDI